MSKNKMDDEKILDLCRFCGREKIKGCEQHIEYVDEVRLSNVLTLQECEELGLENLQ